MSHQYGKIIPQYNFDYESDSGILIENEAGFEFQLCTLCTPALPSPCKKTCLVSVLCANGVDNKRIQFRAINGMENLANQIEKYFVTVNAA